jgi:coproporphyrinogen III oxidase-like Fe-S oxidoreductase
MHTYIERERVVKVHACIHTQRSRASERARERERDRESERDSDRERESSDMYIYIYIWCVYAYIHIWCVNICMYIGCHLCVGHTGLPHNMRDAFDPDRKRLTKREKEAQRKKTAPDGRPLCKVCGQIQGHCKHTRPSS